MKNILYVLILCATTIASLEQQPPYAQQDAAPEEFPAVSINFTINNNHRLEQNNANASSTEQTVTDSKEETKKEKKPLIPDSVMNLLRVLTAFASKI